MKVQGRAGEQCYSYKFCGDNSKGIVETKWATLLERPSDGEKMCQAH